MLLEAMLAESGLEPPEAQARASLLAATIGGLQLDLATSGQVKRTTAAAELLAAQLDEFGDLPLSAFDEAWRMLMGD
jgi:hypothetical protein